MNYKRDLQREMELKKDYETIVNIQRGIRAVIDDVTCVTNVYVGNKQCTDNPYIAVISKESDYVAIINVVDLRTNKSIVKGFSASPYSKLNDEVIKKESTQILIGAIRDNYKFRKEVK